MDLPLYGRALWTYKWLLLTGVVVAAVAALLSGFRIQNGHLQSRAVQSYTGTTTILLTNENSIFRALEPGQAVNPGVSAPQQTDLGRVAQIYAYSASGDEIKGDVQRIVGAFAGDDAITALQRTAAPGAGIAANGRSDLPVLTIVGKANSAKRAELISKVASEAFAAYVTQRQDAAKIPAAQRITLVTLSQDSAVLGNGSNPLIGVVVVGAGTLLIFVVLIFALFNARRRRAEEMVNTVAPETVDQQPEAALHERVETPVDQIAPARRSTRLKPVKPARQDDWADGAVDLQEH